MSTIADFPASLAETLQVDSVAPSDVLRDFDEWDSLTVLTIIDILQSRFGVLVEAKEFAKLSTVGDLLSLVESRASNGK